MNPETLFQKINIKLFRQLHDAKPTSREIVKEIALFQELYTFNYIKKDISENTKELISEIIADNLSRGMGMRGVMKDMLSETSLTSNEAEHIARNEITRINNLGQWYSHKEKGAKSFKINSTKDACELCVTTYKDKLFDINDVEMLPPLHDLCMCVSIYIK